MERMNARVNDLRSDRGIVFSPITIVLSPMNTPQNVAIA